MALLKTGLTPALIIDAEKETLMILPLSTRNLKETYTNRLWYKKRPNTLVEKGGRDRYKCHNTMFYCRLEHFELEQQKVQEVHVEKHYMGIYAREKGGRESVNKEV